MLDVLQGSGDARRLHRERPPDGRRQQLCCGEGGGTQGRVPKKVTTMMVDHGPLQILAPRSLRRDGVGRAALCVARGAQGQRKKAGRRVQDTTTRAIGYRWFRGWP